MMDQATPISPTTNSNLFQTNNFQKDNKIEVLEQYKSENTDIQNTNIFFNICFNRHTINYCLIFLKVLNPKVLNYSQFLYLSCHEPITNNSQICSGVWTALGAVVGSSAHLQGLCCCAAWAWNPIRDWKEADFIILTYTSCCGLQTIIISVWHQDLSLVPS